MHRFWRLLRGYVIITVKGTGLEAFLNRAIDAGIGLWETERLSTGMLVASVSARDFRKVRKICRAQGWRVTLAGKVGLPFFLGALLRRKALVVGAILAAATVAWASSYIWFVDVDAEPGLPRDEILAVAASHGLRPGVPKSRIDRELVRTVLLLEIDELAWASVSVEGTRAVIHVAERAGISASAPGDVIARKDGIVEEIVVFEGSQVARVGDTVKAGDVLIAGFLPPGSAAHRRMLEQGKAPYVRADGIVKARVWYEGRAVVRLAVAEEEPTGRRRTLWELSLGDRRWRLGKPPQFAEARVRERSWTGKVGPFAFGVGRLVVEEVRREMRPVPEEEARRQAIEAARASLDAVLPAGVSAVEPEYEVRVVDREGGPVVEATVRVEVVEEIHGFRKIQF